MMLVRAWVTRGDWVVFAGDRVKIIPINETGTIETIRMDDAGERIIDVTRDSDGCTHLCRAIEIEPERRS